MWVFLKKVLFSKILSFFSKSPKAANLQYNAYQGIFVLETSFLLNWEVFLWQIREFQIRELWKDKETQYCKKNAFILSKGIFTKIGKGTICRRWRAVLLLCAIFFRIWKAKSSSQMGAFFYPMFANWARSKRANIGCSRVWMSFFSSNCSKFAVECDGKMVRFLKKFKIWFF